MCTWGRLGEKQEGIGWKALSIMIIILFIWIGVPFLVGLVVFSKRLFDKWPLMESFESIFVVGFIYVKTTKNICQFQCYFFCFTDGGIEYHSSLLIHSVYNIQSVRLIDHLGFIILIIMWLYQSFLFKILSQRFY